MPLSRCFDHIHFQLNHIRASCIFYQDALELWWKIFSRILYRQYLFQWKFLYIKWKTFRRWIINFRKVFGETYRNRGLLSKRQTQELLQNIGWSTLHIIIFLKKKIIFGGIEKVCKIFRMLLSAFWSLKSFGVSVGIRND